jgi:hypothetical protein
MPGANPDPEDSDWVVIDERRKRYPDEVAAVLLGEDMR